MKIRILSLVFTLSLLLGLCVPALAAADGQELVADTLYTLGLVSGTGEGYQLERAPTRLEAVVMAVRLAGFDREARETAANHPFVDVPAWADGYVTWAYRNGVTRGVAATYFGSSETASAAQCATLVLRVLGFREEARDFSFGTATLVAYRHGLLDSAAQETFLRGDLFELCYRALNVRPIGGQQTLLADLIERGVVDRARANAVGLGERRRITARQAADQLAPAVFYLEMFTENPGKEGTSAVSNASGFFITADGLALTNQHAIVKGAFAEVTTINGEKYSVEKVLFADPELDIALLRVSRTSLDGEECTAFPYLTIQRSDTIHNGDPVYALGSPLGLQNSISAGMVSNRARELEGFELPIIQNTAPISEGSSGGVLLNEYGEAIGITSAYFIYGQSMYIAVRLDPVFDLDWTAEGIPVEDYYQKMLAQAE